MRAIRPKTRSHAREHIVTIDTDSAPRIMFYGENLMMEDLPVGTRVIYPKRPMTPVAYPVAAIRYALNHPEDSEPLHPMLTPGMKVTIAVDDTLFKRSGKKVFGAAWHHDGAAKGPKPIGFGNCWVVAGIVVQLPFLSRPVCLPVLARLWRPRHTGKIAHARELAELIAARYPDRRVHVVGDAAYMGERLRDVDDRISWVQRARDHWAVLVVAAVFYGPVTQAVLVVAFGERWSWLLCAVMSAIFNAPPSVVRSIASGARGSSQGRDVFDVPRLWARYSSADISGC